MNISLSEMYTNRILEMTRVLLPEFYIQYIDGDSDYISLYRRGDDSPLRVPLVQILLQYIPKELAKGFFTDNVKTNQWLTKKIHILVVCLLTEDYTDIIDNLYIEFKRYLIKQNET